VSTLDTTTISNTIKSLIDGFLVNRTPLPTVVIDREFEPNEAWVGIYVQSVSEPPQDQPLAFRKGRMTVRFQIWCWRYAMTNAAAAELRDALVGDIELGLMLDRSLSGTVNNSWLEGGRFNKSDDPQSLGRFFAGGEIILACDVSVSN
jgi:hypothetical protein